MRKKILSAILSVCMVLTLMPTVAFAAETTVTEVGTLEALKTALSSGGNIKLTANITANEMLNVANNIDIDMNGKTITSTAANLASVIKISSGKKLTITSATTGAAIKNETSSDASPSVGTGIYVAGGSLDLDGVDVTGKSYGIVVNAGSEAQFNDTSKPEVTITDATITSGDVHCAAISGNGSDKTQPQISLNNAILNGGLYLPQAGTTKIIGGSVTNDNGIGIGIKSGTLDISGDCTVAGKGEYAEVNNVNSGMNQDGSAILIEANDSYAGNVKINIGEGVKLTSVNSNAIRQFGSYTGSDKLADDFLTISGGTFNAANEKKAIELTESFAAKTAITGGTFSSDPFAEDTKITAPAGYESKANESGTAWTVQEKEIPTEVYLTLKDAIVKGVEVADFGKPAASINGLTTSVGAIVLTPEQAESTTLTTAFNATDSDNVEVKVVKYAANGDTSNFDSATAYSNEVITDKDFFIVRVKANASDAAKYYKIVVSVMKVETAAPEVSVPDISGVSPEQKNELETAIKSEGGITAATENLAEVSQEDLAKVAIADDTEKTDILSAVEAPTGENPSDYTKIKAVTYLNITVSDYKPASDDNSQPALKLDITPMIKLVAVHKDDDGKTAEIGGSKNKAAELTNAQAVEGKTVEIEVQLPDSFAEKVAADGSNLVTKHYKDGRVIEWLTTVFDSVTKKAKFNATSFSEYEIAVDGRSVTVQFSGANTTETYTAASIGNVTFPATSANKGWSFTENDTANGFTGIADEAFFNNMIEKANGGTLTLYPVITSGGGNGGSGGGGGSSATTYTVTVPSSIDHGKITVSPKNASKGNTVTITATPDEGYKLGTITVKDKDGKEIEVKEAGDGKYTFVMPASKVEISAAFVEDDEKPTDPGQPTTPSAVTYSDVAETAWYYDAVKYVTENGLMNGVGNGRFAPNSNLTRAMFAQILYNKAGKPAAGASAFTDVAAGQWYADAVSWAAAQGVVNGIGNGMFGPNNNITREQLAVMLYRYAGSPAVTGSVTGFNDAGQISSYAKDAMAWATTNGVMNGKGDGRLDPKGLATRAEVAQMMQNYFK